jgi:NAD(P)-dependent dehydrogenase (short-subunit alcohol dehydrogenase family)
MSKVWFITGANRGLGRAFVQTALKHGDEVIAAMRKINSEDELFRNENVYPVIADVTDKRAVAMAVHEGVLRFGRIDVLVNNAGYGMSGAFEEVNDTELRELFETDFFGTVNVTRAVLPVMRDQKCGMIFNISSQAGAMGFLGSSAYCSAKYAVVGLSQSLRLELEPFGIQVSAVLPGAFRTDFRDLTSIRLPENTMAIYAESAVGKTRDFLVSHNHLQEGDPMKAAEFLYSVAQSGKLPNQLLIGGKCCNDVKSHLNMLIDEIDGYAQQSSETLL